jgi:hypothetical protein
MIYVLWLLCNSMTNNLYEGLGLVYNYVIELSGFVYTIGFSKM